MIVINDSNCLILQFLKKFALFISLIIGPEIMIKSVVTSLLPYILIFKLEVLGKRDSLSSEQFLLPCFTYLHLLFLFENYFIWKYNIDRKKKRYNKSYITTNHKENSFVEFIIAQILHSLILISNNWCAATRDSITPQQIKINGPLNLPL